MVLMERHSSSKKGSEPLRSIASTALNVNQTVAHQPFLKASFAGILNSKGQRIIKSRKTNHVSYQESPGAAGL